MELVEDAIVPYDPCAQGANPSSQCDICNQAATARVRLKVIDVRCQRNRVVLYEIVKADYLMAPSHSTCNDDIICCGDKGYGTSPYGIVHRRLVFNLARRLEEVLWSAK